MIQRKRRLKILWAEKPEYMLKRAKAGTRRSVEVAQQKREKLRALLNGIDKPLSKAEVIGFIKRLLPAGDTRKPESLYRRAMKYGMLHLCTACMKYSSNQICLYCVNPITEQNPSTCD